MKIHRQFDGKRRVFSRSTARTLHNMFHVSEALFNFRLFFFFNFISNLLLSVCNAFHCCLEGLNYCV